MTGRYFLLAACCLPLLCGSVAYGQAWTQEPGRAYVKATFGVAATSERYDFDGTVVPYDERVAAEAGTSFQDRSAYLYTEVGLIENLTLVGSLSLKHLSVLDGGGPEPVDRSSTDLSTLFLGFRLGLADRIGLGERSAVGVNVGVHLPMGYRRNVAPAVGSGQVDADLLVSYGHSFWPFPAYAQVGGGYRYRTQLYGLSRRIECPPGPAAEEGPVCVGGQAEISYSDQLLARAEAGYTLLERFLVQGLMDVAWSIESPEPVSTAAGVVQPQGFPQQRFVRIGGGLSALMFGDTSLSLQAFTAVYARNTLRAPQFFIGLESRW